MAKPARAANVYPESTRNAVRELSEFFTYRQLSDLIGRDSTTIRQWLDRPREAREPYRARLMLTNDIVAQLLVWSRTPDIAGYFHTPYNGRTVTQAIHDWTQVARYDELLEVIADGPADLTRALHSSAEPTRPARRQTPLLEQPLEHAEEEGRRFVTALADASTVLGDRTLATRYGDIGTLRDDRLLLYPTPALQVLASRESGTSEQKQREHFARLFRTLGWLRPSAGGKSTRVVRAGDQVRRVWDLPAAIVLEPHRIASSLDGHSDTVSTI